MAPRKEPETSVQALVQAGQRHRREAGSGQFDGQREPVESPADRRRQTGRGIVQGERRVVGAATVGEQLDCVGPIKVSKRKGVGWWQRERAEPIDVLALDAERLAMWPARATSGSGDHAGRRPRPRLR